MDSSYPYLWFPFSPHNDGVLLNIFLYLSGISGSPTIQWKLHNTKPATPADIPTLPAVASGSIAPSSAGLFVKLNSSPLSLGITRQDMLSLSLFRQSGTSFTLHTGLMSPYLGMVGLRPMPTKFYRSADGISYAAHTTVNAWSASPLQLEIDVGGQSVWNTGGWWIAYITPVLSAVTMRAAASFRLPEPVVLDGIGVLCACDMNITSDIVVEFRPLQGTSFYPDMSTVIHQRVVSGLLFRNQSASTYQELYIPLVPSLTLQNFSIVFSMASGFSNFSLVGLGDSSTLPVSRYNNDMRLLTSSDGGLTWGVANAIPIPFFYSSQVSFQPGGFTALPGYRYIT